MTTIPEDVINEWRYILQRAGATDKTVEHLPERISSDPRLPFGKPSTEKQCRSVIRIVKQLLDQQLPTSGIDEDTYHTEVKPKLVLTLWSAYQDDSDVALPPGMATSDAEGSVGQSQAFGADDTVMLDVEDESYDASDPMTPLIHIAAEASLKQPTIVADHLEGLVPYLMYDDTQMIELAVQAMEGCAREAPDAVVPHLDEFARIIQNPANFQSDIVTYTIWGFGRLSRERPEALTRYTDDFADFLSREDEDMVVAATDALGHVATVAPERVTPYIDDIGELLSAEEESVRGFAIKSLGYLSRYEGEEVARYLAKVIEIFEEDSIDRDDTDLIVSDIVKNVAKEAPQQVVAYLDIFVDLTVFEDNRDIIHTVAEALGHVAHGAPEEFLPYLERFAELLDHESEEIRIAAVAVFGYLSKERPERVTEYISDLLPLLAIESGRATRAVSDIIADVAAESPEEIRPHREQIGELLEHDDEFVVVNNCMSLLHLGIEESEALLPNVYDFVGFLNKEFEDLQVVAAINLGLVAKEKPEAVAPYTDEIASMLTHENETGVHAGAATLRYIAEAKTDWVTDYIHELAGLLEHDTAQKSAMEALALISAEQPMALREYVDDVAALQTSEDEDTRAAAIDTLQHLAKDDPDVVAPYVEDVDQLLELDHVGQYDGVDESMLESVEVVEEEIGCRYSNFLIDELLQNPRELATP